jgi:hypothetical protein
LVVDISYTGAGVFSGFGKGGLALHDSTIVISWTVIVRNVGIPAICALSTQKSRSNVTVLEALTRMSAERIFAKSGEIRANPGRRQPAAAKAKQRWISCKRTQG